MNLWSETDTERLGLVDDPGIPVTTSACIHPIAERWSRHNGYLVFTSYIYEFEMQTWVGWRKRFPLASLWSERQLYGKDNAPKLTKKQWQAIGKPDLVQSWTDEHNSSRQVCWWRRATVEAVLPPQAATQAELF